MTVTESENTRRNEAIRDWVLELLVVVLSVITLTNDVHGYAKPITWFILALFVLMAIGQSLAISKLSANRKKGSASSDTGTGAVASTSAPSAPSAPSAATSLRVAKLKRSVKTIDLEGKIGGPVLVIGGVVLCFVVAPFTFGLVVALSGVHLVISCWFMVSKTQVTISRLEERNA
jgi:hypothetical protein